MKKKEIISRITDIEELMADLEMEFQSRRGVKNRDFIDNIITELGYVKESLQK